MSGEQAGPPGGTRYLCPLCDWHYDEPPPEMRLRNPPPPNATVDDLVFQMTREHLEETEAAIRDHMMSAHTAPVILGSSAL